MRVKCALVEERENIHLRARIAQKNRQINALGHEVDALRDFLMETRARYASRMPDEWLARLASLLGETL